MSAHGAQRERAPAVHGLTDAPLTRTALRELEQRVDAPERRPKELDATLSCDRSWAWRSFRHDSATASARVPIWLGIRCVTSARSLCYLGAIGLQMVGLWPGVHVGSGAPQPCAAPVTVWRGKRR